MFWVVRFGQLLMLWLQQACLCPPHSAVVCRSAGWTLQLAEPTSSTLQLCTYLEEIESLMWQFCRPCPLLVRPTIFDCDCDVFSGWCRELGQYLSCVLGHLSFCGLYLFLNVSKIWAQQVLYVPGSRYTVLLQVCIGSVIAALLCRVESSFPWSVLRSHRAESKLLQARHDGGSRGALSRGTWCSMLCIRECWLCVKGSSRHQTNMFSCYVRASISE